MATQVKAKREKVIAKPVARVEEAATQIEKKADKATLDGLLSALKIDGAYVISRDGLDVYMGTDAQEIIKQIQGFEDDTPYMFYNPKPFYLAVKNGTIQPLAFPEPKDYGTTSANLFAMAVTCADAISEFIRLKIRGKQGWANQLRQLGMLGMPLVVTIFLIFILAVYIGGS
jgi:hypothetical protein